MNYAQTDRIDLVAIEQEARRMRAEATRNAFVAFSGWLRSRFSRGGVVAHRHA